MTPAAIHPWAWWGWAICLAGAASLTSNPLLLVLLAAVITAVVLMRRSDAPWARSVSAYFALAAFVIGMRVFFQVLIGGSYGEHLLFTLPEIPLPDWAAGIRLGGRVTAEALLYTVYDATRLAVMLLCLGAANSLANPRKALRSVPAALYEASVAVVIALSVAPQLIESTQRVHRARRLRGNRVKGW
ncbi:MAG: energy-coupling factor transporter transmembrane protein EcfT, partial [Propionibacteriaceae bacterium]|nr:energy-coupling factor transporter transmembrane protein EcfT [Propionibacteriaceae bacterium]